MPKLTKTLILANAGNPAPGHSKPQKIAPDIDVSAGNPAPPVRVIWDSEVAGFGARIQRKGVAFIFQYRAGRISRRMVIGFMSELTVEQARRRAVDLRLAVRGGADPLAEIRAKREFSRSTKTTIRDIHERWLRAHRAEWSPATARQYAKVLEKDIVGPMGDRGLSDVQRSQWASVLADIHERSPSVAGLVRRALGSMCGWALNEGLIDAAVDLPKRATKLEPRSRLVSDQEIAAIWAGTSALPGPQAAFSRLVVLSALRSSAAACARAQWLQGNVLTVPGSCAGMKRQKGQRDQHHKVFLSPWALEQVGGLPAVGKPINASLVLRSLRAASGVRDFAWHDIRRSARTFWAAHGISRDAAESALGHKITRGVEAVYNLHRYEAESASAFAAWQTHLQRLVTGEAPANVVALRA